MAQLYGQYCDCRKKVTDIVNDIAVASLDESAGIDQVNNAITNMDEVVQQNGALVEEAAAAASSLESIAQELSDATSIFKLVENEHATTFIDSDISANKAHLAASKKLTKPKQSRLKAPKNKAEQDWEEF